MKKITKSIFITGILAVIVSGSCFAETVLVIRTPIVEIKQSFDDDDYYDNDLEICLNATHHHHYYHGVECRNNRKVPVATKGSKADVKKPAPRRPEPKHNDPRYEPHKQNQHRQEPAKHPVPGKTNGKTPVDPKHPVAKR